MNIIVLILQRINVPILIKDKSFAKKHKTMKQKIIIEKFGPIKKVNLEIDNYLVLIGEQATGKSTIAKLIYFFKSIRHDLISYLYNDSELEQSIDKDFIFKIRQKFSPHFFGTTRHMTLFKLKYQYGQNKFLEITLNSTNKVSVSFTDNELFTRSDESKTYGIILNICHQIQNFRNEYFGKNAALLSTRDYREIEFEKRRKIQLIENEVNTFFEDDKDTFFIPAGRSILSTLSEQLQSVDTYSLDYLMKVFLQSIQRLKSGFNQSFEEIIQEAISIGKKLPSKDSLNYSIQIINEILKGRYQIDKIGEKIYYDKDNFVKLNFASSGQQEVVWILLQIFTFLLNNDKVFLVIEEPEAHLFPVAQKKIIELISLYINQTGSQVVITTHSPYILSSFNNLIYANNIGTNKPSKVSKIINHMIWIDSRQVGAKKIINGIAEDIMDKELNLVKIEEIDTASSIINDEFDKIFNIE